MGNDAYRHFPRLATAVADAEAVAALLERKFGFTVTLLRNASREDTLGELSRLRGDLAEPDSLLIYYAGHGVLERESGTGFWIPVEARQDDDLDWMPVSEITRRLRVMAARHVMVVADSCYSGALTRSAYSPPSKGADRLAWAQRLAQKRSRTALVSGGLEPVLDGGGGRHSVFAKAFLGALGEIEEPLDGHSVFQSVRRSVLLNANQTPQFSDIRFAGHEGGDFVFAPRAPSAFSSLPARSPEPEPPAPQPQPEQRSAALPPAAVPEAPPPDPSRFDGRWRGTTAICPYRSSAGTDLVWEVDFTVTGKNWRGGFSHNSRLIGRDWAEVSGVVGPYGHVSFRLGNHHMSLRLDEAGGSEPGGLLNRCELTVRKVN